MVDQDDRLHKMIGSTTILRVVMAGMVTTGLLAFTDSGGTGSSVAYAAEDAYNACGCRPSTAGLCTCEKKSKCGCPGECEPNGCEERRAKQMEKEIQAETKKAQEADSNRRQREQKEDADRASPKSDEPPPSVERSNPPVARRIVKMTPAQKRDLARLIDAYLAEHPDQGAKAIDQVQAEVSRK